MSGVVGGLTDASVLVQIVLPVCVYLVACALTFTKE